MSPLQEMRSYPPQPIILFKVATGSYQTCLAEMCHKVRHIDFLHNRRKLAFSRSITESSCPICCVNVLGRKRKCIVRTNPSTLDGVSHAPKGVGPIDFQEEWR